MTPENIELNGYRGVINIDFETDINRIMKETDILKNKLKLIEKINDLSDKYYGWGTVFNFFKIRKLQNKLNNHKKYYPEYYL